MKKNLFLIFIGIFIIILASIRIASNNTIYYYTTTEANYLSSTSDERIKLGGFVVSDSVQKGELPAIELISGGILILSAIVLLMPGIVTDTIGLLLMTPTIRRKVASVIAAKIDVRLSSHSGTKKGKIIDTEFKVDD